MGKSSKKTKGPASRPASTSVIPDDKSDMDEESLNESSSPEQRRRKLPAVSATRLTTTQSNPDLQSETTPKVAESYVVYLKGVRDDIIAAVRKEEIKFAREIDQAVGPITLMKFRNKCVCITCNTAEQRQKLLSCKELMGMEIESSLPWTGSEKAMKKAIEKEHAPVRFNKVVITGVSDEWTDEQLFEEIGAEYIRRIKRRVDGQLQPTTAVILGYVENPPNVVKLRYRQYRTRTYIEEPKQCHNCLRFGHLKVNCRSTTRCPRCAGNHSYDECTKKLQQEAVRCANCGENHSAKYRGCAKFAEVKQVLTVAATTKVSYADALKNIRQTKQTEKTCQTPATTGSTVVSADKPKKVMADACTQTETSEIGTQTDEPTAFQEKQLMKTADAVLKKAVGIMDESLRRLKAAINGEMTQMKQELAAETIGNLNKLSADMLGPFILISEKLLGYIDQRTKPRKDDLVSTLSHCKQVAEATPTQPNQPDDKTEKSSLRSSQH